MGRFLGFWFAFFRFCPLWVVKSLKEISFSFRWFFSLSFLLLYRPLVDPFFFLFAYRMARGHEGGFDHLDIPRETPTASSLVAAMSVEEPRLYSQIPIEISLETLDYAATSTVREAGNAIYFTREQFTAGLHLPVPLLVKRFLHFTRAPPVLIHPNVFF